MLSLDCCNAAAAAQQLWLKRVGLGGGLLPMAFGWGGGGGVGGTLGGSVHGLISRLEPPSVQENQIPAPQRPLRARHPEQRASRIQKVKFPAPKRPLRARQQEQRASKIQKVKFPAPKRPLWAWHQEHRT